MNITARTQLNLIIGDPVLHSFSPVIHNAGYKAAGIENEYVFLAATITSKELAKAMDAVRTLHVRGLTCTMPHKIAVIQYLDHIDPIALKIGAVNSVVNENGRLHGYNTDWRGTIDPILELLKKIHGKKFDSLDGLRMGVIGAGGAARAMVFAGITNRAIVTIFNRTFHRAKELADEFGCGAAKLEGENDQIAACDIVLNATSVGMQGNDSPIDPSMLRKGQIIFDAIYHPLETPLLKAARKVGAYTIGGIEMLLAQAFPQFELYTGVVAPKEAMRNALMSLLYQHI